MAGFGCLAWRCRWAACALDLAHCNCSTSCCPLYASSRQPGGGTAADPAHARGDAMARCALAPAGAAALLAWPLGHVAGCSAAGARLAACDGQWRWAGDFPAWCCCSSCRLLPGCCRGQRWRRWGWLGLGLTLALPPSRCWAPDRLYCVHQLGGRSLLPAPGRGATDQAFAPQASAAQRRQVGHRPRASAATTGLPCSIQWRGRARLLAATSAPGAGRQRRPESAPAAGFSACWRARPGATPLSADSHAHVFNGGQPPLDCCCPIASLLLAWQQQLGPGGRVPARSLLRLERHLAVFQPLAA